MKKSRIIVLSILTVAVVALFTGGFGSDGMLTRLVLAGYGGNSQEKDIDTKGPKITHTAVTKAYVGATIEIKAKVKDSGTGVDKVVLNWKFDGEDWHRDRMNRDGRNYTYVIPAQAKAGHVEYYIKAEDEKGNVKNHGRADNPHVISIVYRYVAKTAPATTTGSSVTNTPSETPAPSGQNASNDNSGSADSNQNVDEEQMSGDESTEQSQQEAPSTRNRNIAIVIIIIIGGIIVAWFIMRNKA